MICDAQLYVLSPQNSFSFWLYNLSLWYCISNLMPYQLLCSGDMPMLTEPWYGVDLEGYVLHIYIYIYIYIIYIHTRRPGKWAVASLDHHSSHVTLSADNNEMLGRVSRSLSCGDDDDSWHSITSNPVWSKPVIIASRRRAVSLMARNELIFVDNSWHPFRECNLGSAGVEFGILIFRHFFCHIVARL